MIGFFLRQGGTMAVALFIGAAMVVMVLVIALWGPRTLNRRIGRDFALSGERT